MQLFICVSVRETLESSMAVRSRVVSLSVQQQLGMEPFAMDCLKVMGLDEGVGRMVFVEAMSKMSPAMTMSEVAVASVLGDEKGLYDDDPLVYCLELAGTSYEVLALQKPTPEGLGTVPDVVDAAFRRSTVPLVEEDWLSFAEAIDGYQIVKHLGFGLADFGKGMRELYEASGGWRGTLLDLRLALFFEAVEFRRRPSSLRIPGYDGYIGSLLEAIRVVQDLVLPEHLNGDG